MDINKEAAESCPVNCIHVISDGKIINDNSELFKMMTTPNHEIDAREHLVYYREIIMYHFLENEDLKQSLSMKKYY